MEGTIVRYVTNFSILVGVAENNFPTWLGLLFREILSTYEYLENKIRTAKNVVPFGQYVAIFHQKAAVHSQFVKFTTCTLHTTIVNRLEVTFFGRKKKRRERLRVCISFDPLQHLLMQILLLLSSIVRKMHVSYHPTKQKNQTKFPALFAHWRTNGFDCCLLSGSSKQPAVIGHLLSQYPSYFLWSAYLVDWVIYQFFYNYQDCEDLDQKRCVIVVDGFMDESLLVLGNYLY